jgi:hypothetical protein
MTAQEKIAELRRLEQAATKTPWKISKMGSIWSGELSIDERGQSRGIDKFSKVLIDHGVMDDCSITKGDMKLIAAARNSLPALLEVAEAAMWLTADDDSLADIDKGFAKLTAALSRLAEVK